MTCSAPPASPAPRPLPPALPAPPPDDRLVEALAADTGTPPAIVREWLEGRRLHGERREALLESLWRPLGGLHAR